ncbi:GAF domain-like protein [Artemisia annua]|uniref:GAF domain-like protein n=1 Tax=Artemisia annua TaxID=35608 RepID=A0A2U1KII1_ARTAN|nr:GAF domain-like protein [Artemisia annua]
MDYVSGDSEVDFYDNYEYVQAPTPEFPKISKLKVFYYNHVPRPPTTTNDVLCQRICIALSAISFHDQFVFAQFWAAIEFGSCTVLTTRGQPFGVSVYTKEFWSYRIACLDYNSYVYHKGNEKKVCIGPPARVFLTCSPEWTKDVILYNDKVYPQRLDGLLSKIRGSLAMAVIEGNRCKGVVEIVMTNYKDNFLHEMHEVCRALEGVGLQSSADQNENINIETYEHHPRIRSRETKSSCITRNALTNLFGLSKADAAKRCGRKLHFL